MNSSADDEREPAPPEPEPTLPEPEAPADPSKDDTSAPEVFKGDASAGDASDPAPLAPDFHSPREALALLAASYVLHLLVQRASSWGPFFADVTPALQVMVWIAPAYLLLQRRGEDPWLRHGLTSPRRNLGSALALSLALLGGFVLACGAYAGQAPGRLQLLELLKLLPGQLAFVALKEEYFFRGVLQPALERPGGPQTRILGAPMGRGAVLAAALFALAHLDPFGPNPARLLTFFPALWFAWLRARTGSILPAIVAHAAANLVGIACFDLFGTRVG